MTTEEFEREFDILYNNIMSNAAPSIDAYEKSVFLTKAQEEVVTALYAGSFEASELLTESLNKLVTTKTYSTSIFLEYKPSNPDTRIQPNSRMFLLPNDLLFIVYEVLIVDNTKEIIVKPITHDNYHRIKNNPFQKANINKCLRLQTSEDVNGIRNAVSELITVYKDFDYKIRYIRKPKPIILYNESGLTINGYDTVTLCELDPMLHRIILDTAVKLAVATYKQYSE